ncbi:hypothetical protein L249_1142, partial [Ophiocordyceps polyrhachis-furcata BCC 54312]
MLPNTSCHEAAVSQVANNPLPNIASPHPDQSITISTPKGPRKSLTQGSTCNPPALPDCHLPSSICFIFYIFFYPFAKEGKTTQHGYSCDDVLYGVIINSALLDNCSINSLTWNAVAKSPELDLRSSISFFFFEHLFFTWMAYPARINPSHGNMYPTPLNATFAFISRRLRNINPALAITVSSPESHLATLQTMCVVGRQEFGSIDRVDFIFHHELDKRPESLHTTTYLAATVERTGVLGLKRMAAMSRDGETKFKVWGGRTWRLALGGKDLFDDTRKKQLVITLHQGRARKGSGKGERECFDMLVRFCEEDVEMRLLQSLIRHQSANKVRRVFFHRLVAAAGIRAQKQGGGISAVFVRRPSGL